VNAVDGCTLRRSVHSFAPRVEALEARTCPSVSALVNDHILTIQGDNSANVITVSDGGDGRVTAQVAGAGGNTSLSAAGIDTILINTGDGNDTVYFALRGNLTTNLNLEVRLGSGQDRVDTNLLQDISAGRVNIAIEGGLGRDLVSGRFGSITNTTLTVRADLGSDGDVFNYYLLGGLLGHACARFLAAGGGGEDTMSLHADGVYVAPGAYLDADLRAGPGGVTAFSYQGVMDGILRLHEYGGNRLVADVTLEPGSAGALDAHQRGGGRADRMTFFVNDRSRHPVGTWPDPLSRSGLRSLRAVTEGIEGEGVCYHTANVQALRCAVDEVFAGG
jgi:hypothetical protein